MKTYDGVSDAATEARTYLIKHADEVPDHLANRLISLTQSGTSPVDLVVLFAEAVYANQDAFDAEAKEIASGCAVVADAFGFHDMAKDSRGSQIARVLDGQTVAKNRTPEPLQDLSPPVEAG